MDDEEEQERRQIEYVSDDPAYEDDDAELMREEAFNKWQRNGARCNGPTLRAALWHAQDLGDPVAERAIAAEVGRRQHA
jgi:hypothetical protein